MRGSCSSRASVPINWLSYDRHNHPSPSSWWWANLTKLYNIHDSWGDSGDIVALGSSSIEGPWKSLKVLESPWKSYAVLIKSLSLYFFLVKLCHLITLTKSKVCSCSLVPNSKLRVRWILDNYRVRSRAVSDSHLVTWKILNCSTLPDQHLLISDLEDGSIFDTEMFVARAHVVFDRERCI